MHIFDPPGFVDDFDGEGRAHWHAHMAATTAVQRAFLVAELRQSHPGVTDADLAYVDPTEVDLPGGVAPAGQPWGGFPRAVLEEDAGGDHELAWQIAEEGFEDQTEYLDSGGRPLPFVRRSRQDEYLEWHADSDEHGIHRVSLTCEGPEYWLQLGQYDPAELCRLYRSLVDPMVPEEDLFFVGSAFDRGRSVTGKYNPFNKWNTTHGAVHLTHGANTLGAEINLAARATIPRQDANGRPVTARSELICCAEFGAPNRDSDPSIGLTANLEVQNGKRLTLTDPIGLYISEFAADQITLATKGAEVPGDGPSSWWECVRPTDPERDGIVRMLRIEFTIPDGATVPDGQGGRRPLRLHDLAAGGQPATRGGALAELVTMHLYVTAWAEPQPRPAVGLRCVGTCCRENGRLNTCGATDDGVFPDLVDPTTSAALLSRKQLEAISAAVHDAVYARALVEARAHLGVAAPDEAVAFDDMDGALGPATLGSYASVSR